MGTLGQEAGMKWVQFHSLNETAESMIILVGGGREIVN
jgi:hypothetical protein